MNLLAQREALIKIVIEVAIKLAVLGLFFYVSYLIFRPFLEIIVWGFIIAVAIFPLIEKLRQYFGSRIRVIFLLIVTGLSILIIPSYFLSDRIIESTDSLSHIVEQGKITLPTPPAKVKKWPIIGNKTYQWWLSASENLKKTLEPYKEQISKAAKILLSIIKNTLGSVLVSIISMFIAVFLILDAEKYLKILKKASNRLIGKKGEELVAISAMSIRSVAIGIIGVGLIQASLAMLGLVIMDVPFSLLIAIAVMGLSIIQLPTIIVIGPVIAYVFTYADTPPAIIFTIYMLMVSMSDSVLKPLLLGRGIDIPKLVLITGAIGGMIQMGVIGLFVGAVLFSLLYKLFLQWLSEEE